MTRSGTDSSSNICLCLVIYQFLCVSIVLYNYISICQNILVCVSMYACIQACICTHTDTFPQAPPHPTTHPHAQQTRPFSCIRPNYCVVFSFPHLAAAPGSLLGPSLGSVRGHASANRKGMLCKFAIFSIERTEECKKF